MYMKDEQDFSVYLCSQYSLTSQNPHRKSNVTLKKHFTIGALEVCPELPAGKVLTRNSTGLQPEFSSF